MKRMTPIDDGRVAPGHVTTCADCGCRGVYCDTHAGVVGTDCREVAVDFGDDLVPLLAGREDGTDTDGLYCEDCAIVGG